MSNFIALGNFRNILENIISLSNGDEVIHASIIYTFKDEIIKENLKVKMKRTTYEFGQIEIEEGQTLTSNLVHLDIKPDYQKYSFSKNSLIITGNSPKLGNYKIEIQEL